MRRARSIELEAQAAQRLSDLFGGASGWVPPLPPEFSAAGDRIADEPTRSWTPGPDGPDEPPSLHWSARLRWAPGRSAVAGLCVVAVVAASLAGLLVVRSRPTEVSVPVLQAAGRAVGSPAPDTAGEVVVSVVGRVRRPGLVRLRPGARVDDAVRAAGGATAPLGLLNVARKVIDGEQILVGIDPRAGGSAERSGGGSASTGNGLLDLNAASVGELDGLPGIGPVLAQRIVDWRSEHGRFASVDQLREVPGIGESKYVGLKTKVAV